MIFVSCGPLPPCPQEPNTLHSGADAYVAKLLHEILPEGLNLPHGSQCQRTGVDSTDQLETRFVSEAMARTRADRLEQRIYSPEGASDT